MKKIFTFILIIAITQVFAQSPINKISHGLKAAIELKQKEDKHLVWVYFSDKGKNVEKFFDNPELILSKKSLNRRNKNLHKNLSIDFSDLPVNGDYINKLVSEGFVLKQKSKWFNAVSGYADEFQINQISSLQFVVKIDLVQLLYKDEKKDQTLNPNIVKKLSLQPEGIYALDYGQSYDQLELSNIPQVHELGFNGQGVTICVMDAGFNNLSHEVFQNMNIIAEWDFVNNDSNVDNESDSGDGTHGTAVLSILGGFKEGELIGTAYGANFILAKTENTDSETPAEEDNWIAALEWADSIGVDVTSTSLGYLDYDPPYVSYTWEDMDGNTALITKAADLAVAKGIVFVNSAGNEGDNANHNTLVAPADGDSVIAVGSVDYLGSRAFYSSVGPTLDGRIKPDVMAMGMGNYIATPYSSSSYVISTIGGTSYSCPIVAGVAAILLSANASLSPMQIRDIFRTTSSNSNNPNNLYGWGIINALAAVDAVITKVDDKNMVDNFYLLTSYPNPFNPSTIIRYAVPKKSFVKIIICNILGSEIKTLVDKEVDIGINETVLDGSDLASGIYFVRMLSNNQQKIIKISLIR
ncbi:MAG: S8 family serine peptidase [Ignavibacteriaceae bacterium]